MVHQKIENAQFLLIEVPLKQVNRQHEADRSLPARIRGQISRIIGSLPTIILEVAEYKYLGYLG